MSAYEPCARSMPCRSANARARSTERDATATTRAPGTWPTSPITFSALRPGPTTPQRIYPVTRRTLPGSGPRHVRLRAGVPAARTAGGGSGTETGTVTVLIDTPAWHWRGRLWSHLVSDVSYEELHAF